MMINGMASLPKVQDSANTSVRAFLNQVTKDYGHMFDPRMKTAKGKKVSNDDKKEWERVKKKFKGKCAYCAKKLDDKSTQKEHLKGLNREECGLHHIGNIVPCCASCNKREKINGKYVDWKKQLKIICNNNQISKKEMKKREREISNHMKLHNLPKIPPAQQKMIQKIAENLYTQTKDVGENMVKLWDDLKPDKLKSK